jgi:hypothetical protein
MFSDKINDTPAAVPLLNMIESERGDFGTAETAAQQRGQDRSVTESFNGAYIRR